MSSLTCEGGYDREGFDAFRLQEIVHDQMDDVGSVGLAISTDLSSAMEHYPDTRGEVPIPPLPDPGFLANLFRLSFCFTKRSVDLGQECFDPIFLIVRVWLVRRLNLPNFRVKSMDLLDVLDLFSTKRWVFVERVEGFFSGSHALHPPSDLKDEAVCEFLVRRCSFGFLGPHLDDSMAGNLHIRALQAFEVAVVVIHSFVPFRVSDRRILMDSSLPGVARLMILVTWLDMWQHRQLARTATGATFRRKSLQTENMSSNASKSTKICNILSSTIP